MSEVLFYHLTDSSLSRELPGLVQRSLQRNWKVFVQAGSANACERIDELLWTYHDDSFLPHNCEGTEGADVNTAPIWIGFSQDDPLNADIRFVVEGATPPDDWVHTRVVYMFDGNDEMAVADARTRWKTEKAAGHALTYWQKNETGVWTKKA